MYEFTVTNAYQIILVNQQQTLKACKIYTLQCSTNKAIILWAQ